MAMDRQTYSDIKWLGPEFKEALAWRQESPAKALRAFLVQMLSSRGYAVYDQVIGGGLKVSDHFGWLDGISLTQTDNDHQRFVLAIRIDLQTPTVQIAVEQSRADADAMPETTFDIQNPAVVDQLIEAAPFIRPLANN
ncbi:hypothetical protein [Weissella halotolerans]|uniref:Uncharacterized protein n=1 Tax=Weissella halotolerans DSM 20190 TaxID=1123500 RepID=A0A0R2FYK7_9LACO|nr:hypothetical protein [Weissella halotolerans]KRN33553.1 hypothetical protein IV68_GL000359 [Weissella halotolerans DSM 20190]